MKGLPAIILLINDKGANTMETILKLTNLTKTYKKKNAVDNVNMTINRGDIYGLIGRNGAGKSTLMRLITSLARPNDGGIELFGQTSKSGLQQGRKRMGAIIERPALYESLTAVQNLEYYQRLKGVPDKKIIDETLKVVGLTDIDKKKVKGYSLGMKQRLGIAIALLNNPDFMILDEPTNGLDPMGVVEIRELIKRLNSEYRITLLISTHILAELSLVATRYGIIENGKMIKELTQAELTEACQSSLKITVADAYQASTIIETVLRTEKYKIVGEKEIHLYDYLDQASVVNTELVSNGVAVISITEVGENLEDYFMNLVQGGGRHD